ncbi:Heterokaryon incompatibility 6-like protein [Cladobotryum mycophilum]|uniref:Heterokaryon incompatibility 6-like protein n=1 Tax=Cladobotryum mycophilum TaxID=491253 RepID=A0ABR0SWN7_9HYPO
MEWFQFNFEYDAIQGRPDGDHIRILTLTPSKNITDPIIVTLSTVRLAGELDYEALSYGWGDASDKQLIFRNGKPFPVTKNLDSALRHLRLADAERVLWIDAICIDQNNISERAYQVGLMRDIYVKARRVVIWLGETDSDSDVIFPLCERMVLGRLQLLEKGDDFKPGSRGILWGPNKKEAIRERLTAIRRRRGDDVKLQSKDQNLLHENLGSRNVPAESLSEEDKTGGQFTYHEVDDTTSEETAAFMRLISRPWFTRCWVLQEACLGREAVVICGGKSIDWEKFHLGFFLAVFLGESGLQGRPEETFRGGLILMMLLRMRLQHPTESWRPVDLLWLLWQVRSLQATDSRDKVYSIIGLISEEESQEFAVVPDYSISLEECYKRTALSVINYRQNLDIFLTEQMPGLSSDSPSWVPNWAFLSNPEPTLLFQDDDWDHLDDPESGQFCASTVKHFKPCLMPDGSSLVLSGYVFDRIKELEGILVVPNLDHLALQSSTSSSQGFASFWKTLFGGLGAYFDTLLQWERLAFSSAYPHYPNGEDAETVFAITMCVGVMPDGRESAITGFRKWSKFLEGPRRIAFFKNFSFKGSIYKSIIAAAGIISGRETLGDRRYATATERTLGRRLARTEKGYLAIVPRWSVVGDEVALFEGSKAPLIVRRNIDKCAKQLIGPCYVHGIMYGEAWDDTLSKQVVMV